jgi:hypothetical protein
MASTVVAVSVTVGVKRKRSQSDGPKQFVCDFPECGQALKSKAWLTQHRRSHSKENAPPASFEGLKQHFKHKHIFGIPDGRVWSCATGRFLDGSRSHDYVVVKITGKNIRRHRLNFEIATGRAIKPGMEVDHIVPSREPEDGSEWAPPDDSWANLQELTCEEHRRKTHADNPGTGQKSGVTRGFPVMMLHVASGKEGRYDSITEAAKTFADFGSRLWNSTLAAISKRIREGSSEELRGYVFYRCPEHVAKQADQPGEVWKDAVYDDQPIRGVRVSTLGRIQHRNGLRTRGFIHQGRHTVRIKIKNNLHKIKVYNLVAWAFIGPPPTSRHTVDHIDGDCQNDIPDNLRWATKKEQGRNQTSNRAIGMYDLQVKLLHTYGTIAEAAEENDLSKRQVVYAAETGSRKTGFIWKFEPRVAASSS